MSTVIDAESVVDFLHIRSLLARPQVTPLTGGVSGDTFLVEVDAARVVVKQALSRLRVAGDWTAKAERAMTEAAALELVHTLTPEHTPRLLGADPERNVIVMTAAPADWTSWKAVLLADVPDPTPGFATTAAELGTILATWHERTWHDPAVAERFNDYEAFRQLRVDPFHRVAAAAHPAVASQIEWCIQDLTTRRDSLVHGDFSPKNVLVGADGVMVIDFEVAHVGAPVFDVAFMTSHLALKALHRPQAAAQIAAACEAFISAYEATMRREPLQRLVWHTACLLLARVDGTSPAAYLSPDVMARVRKLALELLNTVDPSPALMWDMIGRAVE